MREKEFEFRCRYEAPLCETAEAVESDMLCTSIDDWQQDNDSFN